MQRAILAAAIMALGVTTAAAQSYPNRPIRFISPYPPGGAGDALLRPIAQKMGERLGQSVVIDSKPGANGVLGTELVAHAAPDGYTLVLGAIGPFAVISAMSPLRYDPVRDFAPIAFLAAVPNVLVVHPSVPVTTVAELVDYARARPGKLDYGSAGPGSSNQLAAELFKLTAKLDIQHVGYRGGAPAQLDLLGGRLTMIFDNMPPALPHIQDGKLRPLAVTSRRRQLSLPEVPTMIEAGFPDFEAGSWFGALAPAGTPRPIIEQLNQAIVAALAEPELRARYVAQGFDLNPGTPEAFAAFIQSETARWHRVVHEAGIKAE